MSLQTDLVESIDGTTSANIRGNTTGTPVPQYMVGETMYFPAVSLSIANSGVYYVVQEFDFTPGCWRVDLSGLVSHGAADGTFGGWDFGLASNGTADGSGLTSGDGYTVQSVKVNGVSFVSNIAIPGIIRNVSVNTSYWVKFSSTWTSGSAPSFLGCFTATRIG